MGIKAAQRKYGIQGDATIKTGIEKFGNLDWENKSDKAMSKSP
jgi:transposase